MSDGHYCLLRDLGPVKGGKGMKHHEVVIDFNRRGFAALIKRAFARTPEARLSELLPYRLSARKASR
jgi:hypothetical protein